MRLLFPPMVQQVVETINDKLIEVHVSIKKTYLPEILGFQQVAFHMVHQEMHKMVLFLIFQYNP